MRQANVRAHDMFFISGSTPSRLERGQVEVYRRSIPLRIYGLGTILSFGAAGGHHCERHRIHSHRGAVRRAAAHRPERGAVSVGLQRRRRLRPHAGGAQPVRARNAQGRKVLEGVCAGGHSKCWLLGNAELEHP